MLKFSQFINEFQKYPKPTNMLDYDNEGELEIDFDTFFTLWDTIYSYNNVVSSAARYLENQSNYKRAQKISDAFSEAIKELSSSATEVGKVLGWEKIVKNFDSDNWEGRVTKRDIIRITKNTIMPSIENKSDILFELIKKSNKNVAKLEKALINLYDEIEIFAKEFSKLKSYKA